MKDVRTRGEGLSSADKGVGFFRCGRLHFLMQKNSDLSKFMVCPIEQGGQFFAFCVDVFYGARKF